MIVILGAFSLFHLALGLASVGLAFRLLRADERALWRSKAALLVAEVLCWGYPLLALGAAVLAWRAYLQGGLHALPIMLAPVLWLVLLGFIFAVVDFAEDGVLGNARARE